MRILLVYGTTEGQTRKIAKFCETQLTDAGNQVDLLESRQRMSDLEISKYECVILAGLGPSAPASGNPDLFCHCPQGATSENSDPVHFREPVDRL